MRTGRQPGRRLGRVAAGAAACALVLAAAPAALGADVAVVVVPRFDPAAYAGRGAVGLLVPGAGSTVSRSGAEAALVRGKVRTSLLGGVPEGEPLIALARKPAAVTIYVALPPPGVHHNVTRYPIAVVGGGYRGILTSTATRIPGLVSVADVAPTAVALARGEQPPIRSRAAPGAAGDLRRLDARLADAHDVRLPARLVLVGAVLAALAAALLFRSRVAARAALLVPPALLLTSLGLSAAHVYRPLWVVLALVAAAAVAVWTGRRGDGVLAVSVVAFLAIELAVLAARPELNALSAIGPHPDGGGRYYGVTNEVETLVLAPALAAAAVVGAPWLLLVAGLALATVGWSGAGADGGGLLVLAAGFAVLWLRLEQGRVPLRRALLVAGAAAALGVGLAALDAALGGTSHVTEAVSSGPAALLDDAEHRWRVSWAGASSSWPVAVETVVGLASLLAFAFARPRAATVDGLLVALALSLLVNDTPQDVVAMGAMTCGALWAWERLHPEPRRHEAYVFQPRPQVTGTASARRF